MAITGSGTSADPWVVHDWDEFLALSGKSLGSSYYAKFCDFNILNGEFVGEGAGTQQNPYICETYNEMLVATGAPEIWNLLRVKDTAHEGEYLYVYDGKYCKFDSTRSTIDFRLTEYAQGIGNITTYQNFNFNGWTFLNVRFNENGYLGVRYGCYANCLRLLNCTATYTSSSSYGIFRATNGSSGNSASLYNSVIQMHINSSTSMNLTQSSFKLNIYQSSLKITCETPSSASFYFCKGSDGSGNIIKDCLVDLDINSGAIHDEARGTHFENCKLKGILRFSDSQSNTFYKFTTSIIDLEYTGTPSSLNTYVTSNTCTLVNSTKITSTSFLNRDGLIHVPESTLSDASAMRAYGFPVGTLPSGGDT